MTWKIRHVGFNLGLPHSGEGERNTSRSTWLAARGTVMRALTREGTGPTGSKHPTARRRHDDLQAIRPGERTNSLRQRGHHTHVATVHSRDPLVPTEILLTEIPLHNGGITPQPGWTADSKNPYGKILDTERLAEALQSAGLDKSRVAIARIEAQMVYVYDFQLLYHRQGVGCRTAGFVSRSGTGNSRKMVTWFTKLRKACASIGRSQRNRGNTSAPITAGGGRRTEPRKAGSTPSGRSAVPTTAIARMTRVAQSSLQQ